MLIFPPPGIYLLAMREGLMEAFVERGGFLHPTCGRAWATWGSWRRGAAISTTNRNFVGRMGHPESEVYLSNPRWPRPPGWAHRRPDELS